MNAIRSSCRSSTSAESSLAKGSRRGGMCIAMESPFALEEGVRGACHYLAAWIGDGKLIALSHDLRIRVRVCRDDAVVALVHAGVVHYETERPQRELGLRVAFAEPVADRPQRTGEEHAVGEDAASAL